VVQAFTRQYLSGFSTLAHEGQEDVLEADVIITELVRFPLGLMQNVQHRLSQIDLRSTHSGQLAQGVFHLGIDVPGIDLQLLQHRNDQGIRLLQHGRQQMQ